MLLSPVGDALGEFGPEALSAMPILVPMTNNQTIAAEVIDTIRKIAVPKKQ